MVGPAPELPDVLGAAVPKVNNLDMTSKGWELQVSWRDRIADFRYGVTFNLSDNFVTIDKYPNPSKTIGTHYAGSRLVIFGVYNCWYLQKLKKKWMPT